MLALVLMLELVLLLMFVLALVLVGIGANWCWCWGRIGNGCIGFDVFRTNKTCARFCFLVQTDLMLGVCEGLLQQARSLCSPNPN